MAYFHWTYLNIGFYIPVLTDWQTQGCFNDIFRNMGYRFVLKEVNMEQTFVGGLLFDFGLIAATRFAFYVADKRTVKLKGLEM